MRSKKVIERAYIELDTKCANWSDEDGDEKDEMFLQGQVLTLEWVLDIDD